MAVKDIEEVPVGCGEKIKTVRPIVKSFEFVDKVELGEATVVFS